MSTSNKVDTSCGSRKLIISVVVGVGLLALLRLIATPEEIVNNLTNWYEQYGYWVIFISALVEGIFVVNLYFPGSTAILLGGALSSQNELSAIRLVILIILGFFIAYIFNYFLGKFGLYRLLLRFGYKDAIEGTRQSLILKGPKMMLVSFFHPNVGSVVTTGAGIINMPFRQFMLWCFVSLVIWDTIWGIVVYTLSSQVINLLGSWLAIPFMLIWILLIYFILRRHPTRV
ncbi:MAG: VTT domain-containing protein [Candidatus Berkelbacteria bacterium]|nr:VTT domain-containing protein [Candidatus Berkelbacteria bacterium]MCR4307626.1 VTT domain-containing protein [Candidatus Berkelbacteria bacterium]